MRWAARCAARGCRSTPSCAPAGGARRPHRPRTARRLPPETIRWLRPLLHDPGAPPEQLRGLPWPQLAARLWPLRTLKTFHLVAGGCSSSCSARAARGRTPPRRRSTTTHPSTRPRPTSAPRRCAPRLCHPRLPVRSELAAWRAPRRSTNSASPPRCHRVAASFRSRARLERGFVLCVRRPTRPAAARGPVRARAELTHSGCVSESAVRPQKHVSCVRWDAVA